MVTNWHKLLNYFHFSRIHLVEAVLHLVSFNPVRFYLVFLLAFNLINWFLAYFINKNVSQNLVILHYNVNLGVSLVGDVNSIYTIPTIGLAFIIINFFLLLNLYLKSKFFIHLLLGFSLLISLFLVASTISIYLINFR